MHVSLITRWLAPPDHSPATPPLTDRLIMHARTNQDLADAVGITVSYASYLRAGKRLPGIALLSRIIEAYGLPTKETLAAYGQGQRAFGDYLRVVVFREYGSTRPTVKAS